jgi:hypothetical protein
MLRAVRAGVFASTDMSSLSLPLTCPSAEAGGTSQSSVAVPLHVTAGSCPHKHRSSTADRRYTANVKVTVSYWAEACQPEHHAIQALKDPRTHVLGRQAVVWLEVHVIPNLRVASILAEHRTGTPAGAKRMSEVASNGEEPMSVFAPADPAAAPAASSLELRLQLARSHLSLPLQVCACARTDVAEALEAHGTAPCATPPGVRDLAGGAAGLTLHPEDARCSLSIPVEPFEAVHTFGRPTKPPHVGVHMPPVHEQLQLAANHFAACVVVVWCADARPARQAQSTHESQQLLSRQVSALTGGLSRQGSALGPLSRQASGQHLSRQGSALSLRDELRRREQLGRSKSLLADDDDSMLRAPGSLGEAVPWSDESGLMWGILVLTKQVRLATNRFFFQLPRLQTAHLPDCHLGCC